MADRGEGETRGQNKSLGAQPPRKHSIGGGQGKKTERCGRRNHAVRVDRNGQNSAEKKTNRDHGRIRGRNKIQKNGGEGAKRGEAQRTT